MVGQIWVFQHASCIADHPAKCTGPYSSAKLTLNKRAGCSQVHEHQCVLKRHLLVHAHACNLIFLLQATAVLPWSPCTAAEIYQDENCTRCVLLHSAAFRPLTLPYARLASDQRS